MARAKLIHVDWNELEAELVDTIDAARAKRKPRPRKRRSWLCRYCGRPSYRDVCPLHEDLPELDDRPA